MGEAANDFINSVMDYEMEWEDWREGPSPDGEETDVIPSEIKLIEPQDFESLTAEMYASERFFGITSGDALLEVLKGHGKLHNVIAAPDIRYNDSQTSLSEVRSVMPPPASARAKRVQDTQLELDVLDYPSIDNKNKPPKDFSEYVRCFFGQKGFGKSTLASQFPGHLTLMFEPRRRNLEIWQLNLQKQTSQQIIDGGPDVFRQVVNTTQRWIDDPTVLGLNFDSIDIFYECCQASVCARHNILVPGDAGKSSSDIWFEIRDEWALYFDLLGASRLSINMLSHVTGRENEDLEGGKYKLKSPSCAPACLKYIKQACDFVFYYGRYNGKRAIQVRDVYDIAFVAAGVGFMQPDGKPIYYLEMPDLTDAKTGYQVLVEAFEGKHWDMDTPEDKRIVPGTAPKPVAKPGARPGPRRV